MAYSSKDNMLNPNSLHDAVLAANQLKKHQSGQRWGRSQDTTEDLGKDVVKLLATVYSECSENLKSVLDMILLDRVWLDGHLYVAEILNKWNRSLLYTKN